MTDMTEELARSLYEADGHDEDCPWENAQNYLRELFRNRVTPILPIITREIDAARAAGADSVWDAGFNLAIAAGELIKATDGQAELDGPRRAALDAMKAFEAIRSLT